MPTPFVKSWLWNTLPFFRASIRRWGDAFSVLLSLLFSGKIYHLGFFIRILSILPQNQAFVNIRAKI